MPTFIVVPEDEYPYQDATSALEAAEGCARDYASEGAPSVWCVAQIVADVTATVVPRRVRTKTNLVAKARR